MEATYDSETDTLMIVFAETPVKESDEDKPGIVLDYDAAGQLVAMEITDASRRVDLSSQEAVARQYAYFDDLLQSLGRASVDEIEAALTEREPPEPEPESTL